MQSYWAKIRLILSNRKIGFIIQKMRYTMLNDSTTLIEQSDYVKAHVCNQINTLIEHSSNTFYGA